MISRRDLLRGTAILGAGAALAPLPALAVGDGGPILAARPFEASLAPDLPPTRLWGFDAGSGASMPGPVLRGRQGERFARTLSNELPEPTSVHWHGLRLPNAMDGVPGLTSPLIAPGAKHDVAFDLRDAGTYWYHSHQRGFEQVERGLHGALIVDEAEGAPDVDADEVVVLDDIRLGRDLQLTEFGGSHDLSHGGRIGNVPLANGRPDLELAAAPGARLRLRLVAAQTARVWVLRAGGFAAAWIVARDGQPLEAPEPFAADEPMGPGQRIDLLVDQSPEGGRLTSVEDGVILVGVRAEGAAQARRPAPAALPPNPGWATPHLAGARTVAMPLEGGAMGRLDRATIEGEALSYRKLARRGYYWAMAGRADMGAEPLITAAVGETVRLDFDNTTMWPHAMHLHGYHFREVLPGGALGPLRDTLLMPGRAQGSVAFVAESPGDWLVHCHMLGHAASGMTSWLRVT